MRRCLSTFCRFHNPCLPHTGAHAVSILVSAADPGSLDACVRRRHRRRRPLAAKRGICTCCERARFNSDTAVCVLVNVACASRYYSDDSKQRI